MATLCLICEDSSTAERYELGDRPLVVGRGEAADLRINDDSLSRQHFLVLREGGDYIVEDLNSRNGTWLGGRRILAARLHHNDRIVAGHTRFLFRERQVAALCSQRTTGPRGTVIMNAAPKPENEALSFA